MEVAISFRVPVAGDDDPAEPENPVQHGDTVIFELTDQFRLLSGSVINLQMGSIPVGHVHLGTDPFTVMVTATVVFDGDPEVFDGTYNTVRVGFTAMLEYDDGAAGVGVGNFYVTILQKTFIVNVSAQPVVYVVTKSGTADLAAQTVTWTVYVDVTQGDVPVDLGGYRLVDQLQQTGPYVPNTFEVNNVPDTPQLSGNTLEYEFPAGSTSPRTITFKTEIPDSHYYASGEQTLRN